MNPRRLISLAAAFLCGPALAETRSADLFTPVETIPAFFRPGEPVAVWNWGTLVSVRDAKSGSPLLLTMDKLHNARSYPVAIPGARSVNLYSGRFAAGPGGWLAVAGPASMGDSRSTSFAALISREGLLQKFVELSQFAPRAMTIAADGTLWIAGVEVVAGRETNPDHHVLRRFDKAGRMVGDARRGLVR